MNKFLFSLSVIITIFSTKISSQDYVTYKVNYDNPDSINNLWVAVDFFGFDYNYISMIPITIGVRANADYKNFLNLNIEFKKAILELEKLVADENIPGYYFFEIGGAFNYFSGIKQKSTKIVLEGFSTGYYT